jgi:hypothetical protein
MPSFHPKTVPEVGDLYGSQVHPRNRPLNMAGVELVAQTHATQLRAIGVSVEALGEMDVLECGGTGRDALAWAALGAGSVTHIDLAADNIQRLEAYCTANGITNVSAVHEDILTIDLPPQAFDIVRSRGVVHHLASPALGLVRYSYWLKTGGLLHFNVYRGGTFHYYGIKQLRRATRPGDLSFVLVAIQALGLADDLAGALLDDLFVPYMHTASPKLILPDLAFLEMERLWPDKVWAELDHGIRYPDLPEKDEHLQFWLRKTRHFDDPEETAGKMQYGEGVDDVALAGSVPEAGPSLNSFSRFHTWVADASPEKRALALVRVYTAHYPQISTATMTAGERHEQLTTIIERVMADSIEAR